MAIGTDILQAISEAASLEVQAIAEASGHSAHAVARSCGALVSAGLVVRLERGCYAITPDGTSALAHGGVRPGPRGGQSAPASIRTDTVRDRIWTALRMRRKATLDELAILAGEPGSCAYQNAKKFVQALQKSGHVTLLPARRDGARLNIRPVLLLLDTGPIAPVVQLSSSRVYDPNNETHYKFVEAV